MGLIAIGDIHGCAETLNVLLGTLDPDGDDRIVFVGDYVDRGPDSRRVIDIVLELRQSVPCVFLRGNHEALMLDYLDHRVFEPWRANGGLDTLESYVDDERNTVIPDEHERFLRETRLYHEEDDYCFVHAGLRPEYSVAKNLERNDEGVFLWERSHLKAPRLNWEKTVVCGHTPVTEPINQDQLINVDTGCVYHNRRGYGRLTAVRLPEREFISIPYQE